jgi:threonine efflux protein
MNYAVVLGGVFAIHVLAMLSPGPNFLIVTQTAAGRTRRAGVFTALGIAAGAAAWAGAALLGLSVVFAHFAWLHGVVKLLGGMYLVYLGIKLWRAADRQLLCASRVLVPVLSDGRAFRLGLMTNLTNPKAVIFYGSIFAGLLPPTLPQWVKLAAIGIIIADAVSWHVALACLFSTPRARRAYARMKRYLDRIVGAALALLGLQLAYH